MIGYFVYFQTVVSSNVITSPYNKRQDMFADRIVRGDILTGDGTVIATTKVAEDGSEKSLSVRPAVCTCGRIFDERKERSGASGELPASDFPRILSGEIPKRSAGTKKHG